MSTEADGFSESDFVNYSKEIVGVLKQHGMLAPGEEDSLRRDLYYS